MRALVLLILLFDIANGVPLGEVNSFDPEYGVFLGDLSNLADGEVKGKVFVVNETALQIIDFSYNGNAPDLYFWLDKTDSPTPDGIKVPSFEYGITPLGEYKTQNRVVLLLPGLHKITEFRSFSLYCFQYGHNFGMVPIPENVQVPKPQFLNGELKGSRYSVSAGPILVVDRRTIKVFGFTFDGDKAPDGYFFVGRGPNVAPDAGVKVPIRGRDTSDQITAMNERYRGGQDPIIELPEDYDIGHIDWLSIYCYKFRVDFGHVPITNISNRIPPFVPQQKRFDELTPNPDAWTVTQLLGNDQRRNFTFQLGLPGGKRGYQAMARSRAPKYVWYVNGYLAEIYLKKGITYTFIVEGGNDKSIADFNNPLYITDSQYGGFNKLSKDEKQQVQLFSGADPSEHVGRLCLWTRDKTVDDSRFSSFSDFRKALRLNCEVEKQPAIFEFTPTEEMPKTLYFQSATTYNMGYKIHLVNEMPTGVADIIEEPYRHEDWIATQHGSDQQTSSSSRMILSGLLVFIMAILLQ